MYYCWNWNWKQSNISLQLNHLSATIYCALIRFLTPSLAFIAGYFLPLSLCLSLSIYLFQTVVYRFCCLLYRVGKEIGQLKEWKRMRWRWIIESARLLYSAIFCAYIYLFICTICNAVSGSEYSHTHTHIHLKYEQRQFHINPSMTYEQLANWKSFLSRSARTTEEK